MDAGRETAETVPETSPLGDAVDDVDHRYERRMAELEPGPLVVASAQLASEQVGGAERVGVCSAQVLHLGDPA